MPTPPPTQEHDPGRAPALLIVDGANVVGSVPDGWWRDRRGAAERLRDRLAGYLAGGVPGVPGPLEIVLVLEGAARGVPSVPGVRIEEASGSGDDHIVRLAAATADRARVVVTADRELRRRVTATGATTVGPRTVYDPDTKPDTDPGPDSCTNPGSGS
ncbi:NTP pyrophosphohydrolase [Streptomyces sp. NPDC001276]|uniref:NTP pyrophosphohydrolase n=1 Tax=Streptomyces sp. NPDC001276 TaxID=3364555 RepID=UPI0036AD0C84